MKKSNWIIWIVLFEIILLVNVAFAQDKLQLFSFAKAMETPVLLRRNYSDGEYSCEAIPTVPLVLRSRIESFKKFRETHGGQWVAEWDKDTGRLKALRAQAKGMGYRPIKGDAGEVTKQFLKENFSLFSLPEDIRDIEIFDIKQGFIGYHHVFLKQNYNNLPVFNGGMDVHIDNNNQVFLVYNYYAPNISISTAPVQTVQDIVDIAKSDFVSPVHTMTRKVEPRISYIPREDQLVLREKPELGVFILKDKAILAYRLNLSAMEYIIDANTGAILQKRELVQH